MDSIYQIATQGAKWSFIPTAFEHPFMLRGLISALIVGPMLGSIGSLIIAKRMVFFSQTISHASLTGVALGLLLGEAPGETYGGLYGFTLLVALLMLYVRNRTRTAPDTIVGVVLAQTLGLGVVSLVMVTKQFNVHQVEAILFGSLITITEKDIFVLMLSALLCGTVLVLIYNHSMLIGLNPVIAKAQGINTVFLEYLFVAVITVVIVASLKIIGALLVLALIVIPSAAAQNIFNNLLGFFWCSVIFATTSAVGGLVLSAIYTIPIGAAIVLIASILFYLSLILRVLMTHVSIQQGSL